MKKTIVLFLFLALVLTTGLAVPASARASDDYVATPACGKEGCVTHYLWIRPNYNWEHGWGYRHAVSEYCADSNDEQISNSYDTYNAYCTYGDWIDDNNATCSSDATKHATCLGCGYVKYETIWNTRLSHTEVIDEAVAPTCTRTGLTAGKHCSVCLDVLVKQKVVPANGHTEVVDEAVAPTCTRTGLSAGKHCSVCLDVLVKQEIVPATGHTEIVDEAVAPTCTSAGLTEGTHCLICQTILVSQEKISAMGHVYRMWTFAGKHTHSADCTRSGCRHVETVSCPLYEIQVDDAAFDVCPVCGACDRVTFERIKQAACTNIAQNAIPSGVLFVYGAASPFGTEPAAIQGLSEPANVLYALTVTYERAGYQQEFRGQVQVTVPVKMNTAFTLIRLNSGAAGDPVWNDVPFTMKDGVISFETDRAGMYLLIAAQ